MSKYATLKALLEQNRSGKLCSVGPDGGGFRDIESGRPKLCGVMRFLKEKTKAFPKLSRKQYRALSSKKKKNGTKGEKSSTKRGGDSFHRNVYHTLFCLNREVCRCLELFGKATKRSPAKSSTCFLLVKAALEFLEKQKLVAVAAEQVIVSRDAPVGTRFDCLCHDTISNETVLISWKTGYKGLTLPQVVDCNSMMHQAVTSDEMSLREHIAQLTVELHALQDTHNIPIQRAYIVYLSTLGTYRYTALEHSWIVRDYRTGWRWLLDKFEKVQQLKRKSKTEPKKKKHPAKKVKK